jgi:hypothetical protein
MLTTQASNLGHPPAQSVYAVPMPRVLLNFQLYGDAWTVHFIQDDCRTRIGRRTRYSSTSPHWTASGRFGVQTPYQGNPIP